VLLGDDPGTSVRAERTTAYMLQMLPERHRRDKDDNDPATGEADSKTINCRRHCIVR